MLENLYFMLLTIICQARVIIIHCTSIILSHFYTEKLIILLHAPRRLCFRRCLFVCLSVCLLATLHKNFQTVLHDIFRQGWQWAIEQMIKFWWRSRLQIRIWIQIRITTLVRRALAEVCTVSVLPVFHLIKTTVKMNPAINVWTTDSSATQEQDAVEF